MWRESRSLLTWSGRSEGWAEGNIATLRNVALRARVYLRIDPVTKKRHYLTEMIPRTVVSADFTRSSFRLASDSWRISSVSVNSPSSNSSCTLPRLWRSTAFRVTSVGASDGPAKKDPS